MLLSARSKKNMKVKALKSPSYNVLALPDLTTIKTEVNLSSQTSEQEHLSFTYSPLVYFIMFFGIFLTISTMIYYYNISKNIVTQRQEIITLYKKLQTVKDINNQSKVLLDQIRSNRKNKNTTYLLIDNNNSIDTQSKQMVQNYYNKSYKNQKTLFFKSYKVIFASLSILIIICMIRLFSLKREQRKIFISDSLHKKKEAF
jgi:NADH:ubiquinone oxidoreductase subunit 6 (subunit J)